MTSFLDIFNPIEKGNHGLTDEAIYKSLQRGIDFIPVYGAYQDHNYTDRTIPSNGVTIDNQIIKIFNNEGVIINFDGKSAGRMTYKNKEKFALNHHAGFFTVKEGCEKKIIPEYYALFYSNILHNASVSSDQNTLTFDMIYSMDFNLVSFKTQLEAINKIKPLLKLKNTITNILNIIDNIKTKILYIDYNKYQNKSVSISDILICISGNHDLTESEIYKKILLPGPYYEVLSSATSETTKLGFIPKCVLSSGCDLKVLEDKEAILVIRNGNAGKTYYLNKGKYSITDHAYLLCLRDNIKYDISLEWLKIQYQNDFLSYSSSSDNGTWNKTGFFDNLKIDIPDYKLQVNVVNEYNRIIRLENKLNKLLGDINFTMDKVIIE